MKFLLEWRLHESARHEAFESFSKMTPEDDLADHGEAIRLIGRWHDLAAFTGVAICEADDASAVAHWALNWNNVLDLEVTPVLDDEEARAVGRARFG